MIILTHMVSGMKIYVRSPQDIALIMHAPLKTGGAAIPWIIVGDAPALPIQETFEEILVLAGFKTKGEIDEESKIKFQNKLVQG